MLFKIVIVTIIILLVILLFIANMMATYSLSRSGGGDNRKNIEVKDNREPAIAKIIDDKRITEIRNLAKFLIDNKPKKITIKSNDGLKLTGFVFRQKPDTHRWAIIVHGYRKDHKSMTAYTRNFYEKGFNILVVDLRACGESEGKFLSYGYFEKEDISLWCDYIIKNDVEAEILLFGHSMGATVVMQYAGIDDKKQVKCFIEDCGFTNAWDMNKIELKKRFNIPSFPILHLSNLLCRVRFGFYLNDADAVNALKKCAKPMMFIHGTCDNYVPFEMLDVLYDAIKSNKKEKIIAEGASHVESIYLLGDKYFDKIVEFFNNIG